VLYADKACPHIEWLIEHRRTARAKKYQIDNAQLVAAEKRRETQEKLATAQATALTELLGDRKARTPRNRDTVE
jgi:hypothetical protein